MNNPFTMISNRTVDMIEELVFKMKRIFGGDYK